MITYTVITIANIEWTAPQTGSNRIKALEVFAVSMNIVLLEFVAFVRLTVSTVSSVMLTPEPASIMAQTIPGTRYIALARLCDWVNGVSRMVDMISINSEDRATNSYMANSRMEMSDNIHW